MKLTRPEGCEFEIGEQSYRVPAITRDQMRRTLALDAEIPDGETAVQMDARRAAQLAILVERSEPPLPLGFLSADEEIQILTALVAQHHGMDPAQAVATANAVKKNAILAAFLLAPNGSPTSTPPPSSSACTSAGASPHASASPT